MMKFSLKNSLLKSKVYVILGLVFLIILWEISAIIINNNIYLPRIEEVFSSILLIIKEKSFVKDSLSSFLRSIISFVSALFIAVILGVISTVKKPFREFLKPINAIIKTIPTMVLVVLSLVWFDKDKTPYLVGILIVFPIFYEGIIGNLLNVDYKIIQMCKIYNIKIKEMIKKIYIPVIINFIENNFVSSFSLAFKVVIAGEVHGQPKYGIGSSIQNAKANFDVSKIFGWIIIIAFISIIFDAINMLIRRKANKWRIKNEN